MSSETAATESQQNEVLAPIRPGVFASSWLKNLVTRCFRSVLAQVITNCTMKFCRNWLVTREISLMQLQMQVIA